MGSPIDRADLQDSLWHLLYSQLRAVKQYSLSLLCRAWLVQPHPEVSSKKKNEAIKNTHMQARKHLIIDLGLKKGN